MIKFKHLKGFKPIKANEDDIAYDFKMAGFQRLINYNSEGKAIWGELKQDQDLLLHPNKIVKIWTGFSVDQSKFIFEIRGIDPSSIWVNSKFVDAKISSEIHTRSGHGFNQHLELFNGQIDTKYNNQVYVLVRNNSNTIQTIKIGERIGQIEFKLTYLFPEDESEEVNSFEELDGNNRGGFGSSGK